MALLNVKSCIKDSSGKQFLFFAAFKICSHKQFSNSFLDSACIANFEALGVFKGFNGLNDSILNDLLQICFRPAGR
jgi:hypothetical protein